jgi:hypothetical protein
MTDERQRAPKDRTAEWMLVAAIGLLLMGGLR